MHLDRRYWQAVAIVVVGVGILLASVAAAQSTPAATRVPRLTGVGDVLVTSHPNEVLPRHGGTVNSLNWSGYAVTPPTGTVTAVSSTFVVPSAAAVPPGFAATWTGIGGYNRSDLIQAGVSENSLPSNPLVGNQYSAWYELLPASETPITDCTGSTNCPVAPGDTVTVGINQVASGRWSIDIGDATEHWTWSKIVSYSSSESSAEWILEAPTLVAQTLLANVGTAHFGPISTYTAGGSTHTIAQGNPTQIDLSPGLANEATPSPLAPDGQSFNVCAYAQSCAAP